MKKVKYALLVFLTILSISVLGDIITFPFSPTKVCVKIENLEDYPDITIIGLSNSLAVFSKPVTVNIIDSESSLEVQKALPLTFYAVKKEYLKEKGVEKINWKKDINVRKSDITINAKKRRLSSPNVETLEIGFVIAGFNENSMVMYEKSQKSKYNDGRPDLVQNAPDTKNYPEYQNLQKTF